MSMFYFFAALLLALVSAQDDLSCGPNKPCAIGCCGTNNICGLGPNYCSAEKCIGQCDRKSDCDPGWGPQWSSAESCPLNVCCSQFGFCGTTSDFCGSNTVTAPSCGGSTSNGKTIGYYEGWSVTRACDKMYPEQIPTSAYTHLNFAFALVDPNTFQVAPMSEGDVELYTRFTALKDTNQGLQTWISVGGWSMNDPDQPTADTFSALAGSTDAQSKFISSLISFMQTYGFDGVDIDWEYPVASERSGNPEDFSNYVSFLQNIRNGFASAGHNYGLSITIPSSYWYMRNFDIVKISKIIDWFNVMTYDLHGTWDSTDKYIGSFVYAHTNLTEIDNTLNLLWRNDIDPGKVVLGLGFYGRSYTLSDPSCTSPGCPFSAGALPGPCTASSGTLSFSEINNIIKSEGATVTLDEAAAVKQVVWNSNQWVSYDDADTFMLKIAYANQHCLGGTMVWAASLDDTSGTAADSLSSQTGRKQLSLSPALQPDSISSCLFSQCGAQCPPGTSPAQSSSGGSGANAVNTGCSSGQSRYYCCPTNDQPQCVYRGTAPFCNGKCHDGEVEVTSSISGTGKSCWTGHKVLCCTRTTSDTADEKCKWEGSAPFCAGAGKEAGCSESDRSSLTKSTYGAGGEQECTYGYKSFCCTEPPPYQNCAWEAHGGSYLYVPFLCSTGGSCPAGKQGVAVDPTGCISGTQTFCCDSPATANDPTVNDFRSKLQSFASNPSCSTGRMFTRDAHPANLEDKLTADMLNQTRHRLAKRGGEEGALSPIIFAAVARPPQSYQQQILQTVYNQTYGDSFNLHGADFEYWINSFPEADPEHQIEGLLCEGNSAHDLLTDYQQAVGSTGICSTSCRRASASKRDTTKRNLDDSDRSTRTADQLPSWYMIVDQLTAGTMPLIYERFVYANQQMEPLILELAFGLPRDGQGNYDTDYQDPRYVDPQDQFFVIHMHVDHMRLIDGSYYVGVTAATAFHGQYINSQGRVDGSSNGQGQNRNARTNIANCEVGGPDENYWYPGLCSASDPAFGRRASQLARLGQYLNSRGFLSFDLLTDIQAGGVPVAGPDSQGRRAFRWNPGQDHGNLGQ